MRLEPVQIASTPRLERIAASWARARRRPARIDEPGPDQESVWDYPRPPSVQRVGARITVVAFGELVADTERALRMCETASPPTYYLPSEDVNLELLHDEPGQTVCEWKGAAAYHSIAVGDRLARRAAWSYPAPYDEYELLAGMLSFYPARVDACMIDGVAVTPQPGDFYGGWITADLVGPFKGEPGSHGW